MRLTKWRSIAVGLLAAALGPVMADGSVSAARCASGTSFDALGEFLAGDDAAGLGGADYARAIDLPDGRVLWTFQDAFLTTGSSLVGSSFHHNFGMLQTGACFELLGPVAADGGSWIGGEMETLLKRWWWPLDAEVGADGYVWVFLAEMYNPNGTGATAGLLPAGTWVARLRPDDLTVATFEPAPDPSADMYGYSIVSDDAWTYLYANCYRQFVPGQLLGFDPTCSPFAYLARVPKGRFDRPLEYRTSDGWSFDRTTRVPVFHGHTTAGLSVQRYGDTYVNVNDDGEWFGPTIEIWTARQPQGPWTLAVVADVPTKCGDDCFHYGAFLLPDRDSGRVGVLLSHNSRIVSAGENENAWQYRQSVLQFDVPGIVLASATLAPPDEPPIAPMPIVLAAVVAGVAAYGGVAWRVRLGARPRGSPAVHRQDASSRTERRRMAAGQREEPDHPAAVAAERFE